MIRLLFDEMLSRTATWSRIFGVDSAHAAGKSDSEIIKLAKEEGRTLITRDAELAGRCKTHGIPFFLLEDDVLSHQLGQLKSAFGDIYTFPEGTRCPACNGKLAVAGKEAVRGKVLEGVLNKNEKFWVCTDCGKTYWEGSHWKNILRVFKSIK
ncbi:Mut7-C RNAse domain-containing protein [Candidatus Micrarchaeota archaeon]|nr:Mut7-C RNAse domain-containing protein [Candidatus Micrarchaeota archaeon]